MDNQAWPTRVVVATASRDVANNVFNLANWTNLKLLEHIEVFHAFGSESGNSLVVFNLLKFNMVGFYTATINLNVLTLSGMSARK